MKTLLVAPFSPFPLVFGGAIRVHYLMKMLASFSEVTLLAYRSWADVEAEAVQDYLETICHRVMLVDGKPAVTNVDRVRSVFCMRSFQYDVHYSQHFQLIIDDLLAAEQFDVIVVEMTQMGYFRYHQPGALRVLDMQNIEYELLFRRAEMVAHPLKRAAFWLEAQKCYRDEIAICRSYDLIFTPSDRERLILQRFKQMPPVETLPNTIDVDYFAFHPQRPITNQITFIGATQVDANRDGLRYFMTQILPLIEQHVPDVRVSIVGGDPPPEIVAFGQRPNVEVTGFVPDVRTYMEQATVLVVPLRSGGGTRLKILEGLAFGVPTISTSVGAEGLNLVAGEHLLIADTPQAFATHVVQALTDSALQKRLSVAGRRFVEVHYSWRNVAIQLHTQLERALGLRSTVPDVHSTRA
ncbi:glycosyltransferase family 4 protein [Candidatus Chloroploca sp. Khr17]|uniref:glycosyltransferase family 4 protein n=1 Tax=Candidatus Chloroploca sp. Khr17 TaxID=2496869 RepID=UPI00101D15AD|nr:glycosyltransferase family 4 protein [Candidatus Chloroploca sp. Khr17]